MKAKSKIAQSRYGYAGNTNVNSLSLHMQAVRGHAGRRLSQELIAPGTAISADDVNFRLRTSCRSGQIMEQVEQTGVKSTNRSRAMIAQKSIEAINCIREVSVASPVNQVNLLVRVGMVEPQPVFTLQTGVGRSGSGGQTQYPDQQDYCEKSRRWISVCSHVPLLSQESGVSERSFRRRSRQPPAVMGNLQPGPFIFVRVPDGDILPLAPRNRARAAYSEKCASCFVIEITSRRDCHHGWSNDVTISLLPGRVRNIDTESWNMEGTI